MRQIVLDTETTGLSPQDGDRIIEIGCVELVNRQLTGNNRHYYLNPERDIHEDALRVHGITLEFLADKPRFADIAPELLEASGLGPQGVSDADREVDRPIESPADRVARRLRRPGRGRLGGLLEPVREPWVVLVAVAVIASAVGRCRDRRSRRPARRRRSPGGRA